MLLVIRFLKKLRLKQRENHIIDSIADILVEFFSALSAQRLKSAYGELFDFISNIKRTFKTVSSDKLVHSLQFRCNKQFNFYKFSMETLLCNEKGFQKDLNIVLFDFLQSSISFEHLQMVHDR